MKEKIFSPGVVCPTENAVLRTLLYFEIFSYPLTTAEITWYLHRPEKEFRKVDLPEVEEALEKLTDQRRIFKFGPYYQTVDDPDWSTQRINFNRSADRIMPLANRMAALIGSFPFIRGVFVSGSLSKHSMKPDSDIDFFLVTVPGRLWLARTLLVLFKKIFLFNSHKYFCVNYFIDTEHLSIEEHNIYTATEAATLLPLYGREWYVRFCAANTWIGWYLPNATVRTVHSVPAHSAGLLKRILERFFGGRLGGWLDQKCMHITVEYWKKKFNHFDHDTFEGALKSRKHVSKHHPLDFQTKVLNEFEKNVGDMDAGW
jgi:hypothetical protein